MNEYSIDLERLEAKRQEMAHKRAIRKIMQQNRNIQRMERRETLLEYVGAIGTCAATVAIFVAGIIMWC